jgi:hypothetical protein
MSDFVFDNFFLEVEVDGIFPLVVLVLFLVDFMLEGGDGVLSF